MSDIKHTKITLEGVQKCCIKNAFKKVRGNEYSIGDKIECEYCGTTIELMDEYGELVWKPKLVKIKEKL